MRDPYSANWFDYDVSAGISFPGQLSKTDFDNHGDSGPTHARAGDFVDLTAGATMQLGGLGVAATSDLQTFTLTNAAPGTPSLTLQAGRWRGLGAYGMFDGQLAVGGGARVVTMQLQSSASGNLLTMTGFAPEAGALLMPTGRQWRLGATVRAPVNAGIFGTDVTTDTNGLHRAGSFVLPDQVVLPWEVEVGVAYQLGPRPLNPGWHNPHADEAPLRARIDGDRGQRAREREVELRLLPPRERRKRAAELDAEEASLRAIEDARLDAENDRLKAVARSRYANWPRERILLLASVLLSGPTTGGSSQSVSLEGFLDQKAEIVGRNLSATPRFGLEGEPIHDRLTLRAGTYVEPSRYDSGSPRQHFTFGGDVRLFPLDFWGLLPRANWKIGLFVDLAPRYVNGGIGIGEWH
ncbi:MAG: hypothetical protein ACRENE_00230 [Polyangiaceae bacterium]